MTTVRSPITGHQHQSQIRHQIALGHFTGELSEAYSLADKDCPGCVSKMIDNRGESDKIIVQVDKFMVSNVISNLSIK